MVTSQRHTMSHDVFCVFLQICLTRMDTKDGSSRHGKTVVSRSTANKITAVLKEACDPSVCSSATHVRESAPAIGYSLDSDCVLIYLFICIVLFIIIPNNKSLNFYELFNLICAFIFGFIHINALNIRDINSYINQDSHTHKPR